MPSFGSLQFYHIKIHLAEVKNSCNCFQEHRGRKTFLTGLLRLGLWAGKSSFQEGNFTTARLRHATPSSTFNVDFVRSKILKKHFSKSISWSPGSPLTQHPDVIIWASTQPSNSPGFCPDAKYATSPVGLAQPLTPFRPYQKSTESINKKIQNNNKVQNKHLDLAGLHHVEIVSMKHVYVKTSMRKVKTPGISSSSTVLKAFSPDFQAWTALEVLPQPRAFNERAVLGTWKNPSALWKTGGKNPKKNLIIPGLQGPYHSFPDFSGLQKWQFFLTRLPWQWSSRFATTFASKDLADEMEIFTMEYHVYEYTVNFEFVCKYPYHHIEDVLGIQLLNLKLCLSIHVVL